MITKVTCEACFKPCNFRIEDKGHYVCQRCFSSRQVDRNRIHANVVEDNPTFQDLANKWNNRDRFDN